MPSQDGKLPRLPVRTSPQLRSRIKAAAKAARLPMSRWCRHVLTAAVDAAEGKNGVRRTVQIEVSLPDGTVKVRE